MKKIILFAILLLSLVVMVLAKAITGTWRGHGAKIEFKFMSGVEVDSAVTTVYSEPVEISDFSRYGYIEWYGSSVLNDSIVCTSGYQVANDTGQTYYWQTIVTSDTMYAEDTITRFNVNLDNLGRRFLRTFITGTTNIDSSTINPTDTKIWFKGIFPINQDIYDISITPETDYNNPVPDGLRNRQWKSLEE